MAVYRTYQCPACEKTFDFLHHPNDEPPPSFCPLCGADVSGKKRKKVDRVLSPGLSERVKRLPRSGKSNQSKSVDMVYNGMVGATNGRMEEAAALLGCDASSLSAMKMTDMKDNMRAGDLSGQSHTPAKDAGIVGEAPVFNLGGGAAPMQAFQSNGAEYAKTVGTGPSPFAGNRIREMVTSSHGMRSQSVTRNGQLNKV